MPPCPELGIRVCPGPVEQNASRGDDSPALEALTLNLERRDRRLPLIEYNAMAESPCAGSSSSKTGPFPAGPKNPPLSSAGPSACGLADRASDAGLGTARRKRSGCAAFPCPVAGRSAYLEHDGIGTGRRSNPWRIPASTCCKRRDRTASTGLLAGGLRNSGEKLAVRDGRPGVSVSPRVPPGERP